MNFTLRAGKVLFCLAIVAMGGETLLCAGYAGDPAGPAAEVMPVLPFLPAISWLAYVFGTALVICGVSLLASRIARPVALVLGSLLFLPALIFDLPRYAAHIHDMGLRTAVFEPLALACLAWLMPTPEPLPGWLKQGSRYVLGLSLVVFGVDHFIGIVFIASLIPAWIPLHVFLVGLFGVLFIVCGLSIALNIRTEWGAFAVGSMFAIWVLTLHLPRVMGLYGIAGAPRNPNEWSSLFIAIALWGGPWAMACPTSDCNAE